MCIPIRLCGQTCITYTCQCVVFTCVSLWECASIIICRAIYDGSVQWNQAWKIIAALT